MVTRCFIAKSIDSLDCNKVDELIKTEIVSQVSCEEILTKYARFVQDTHIELLVNALFHSDTYCFKAIKGQKVRIICEEGHKVFLFVKPGDEMRVGKTIGYTYSSKRIVRKIKGKEKGIVIAVIQVPMSRPEKICVLLKTTNGEEDGQPN